MDDFSDDSDCEYMSDLGYMSDVIEHNVQYERGYSSEDLEYYMEEMAADVDFISEASDDSDPDSEVELPSFGTVVERFRSQDEKGNEGDAKNLGESAPDMWTTLPDEVMMLIVARLPFSSFCSFRSVCRKWNTLMVYPDAAVMTTRDSQETPLGVIYAGADRFASYSLSSHSWQIMPTSFGSFGVFGLQGEKSRVLAGAGGLLVVESEHLQLWVVNPVNKSERRLPPPVSDGIGDVRLHLAEEYPNQMFATASIRNVHVHLGEDDSYKVFVVFGEEEFDYMESPELGIQIYDSKSDAWERFYGGGLNDWDHIISIAEYNGDLWFLVFDGAWDDSEPCRIYVRRRDGAAESNPTAEDGNQFWDPDDQEDLPDLPVGFRGGQLFVKDGNVMLGGVTLCLSGYGPRMISCAHIWRLNCSQTRWHEVARMPSELTEKIKFDPEAHVAVQGDFMWVTDYILGELMDPFVESRWLMCHISSNTWWLLPRYTVKSKCVPPLDEMRRLYRKSCRPDKEISFPLTCALPFLFEPRMGLVV